MSEDDYRKPSASTKKISALELRKLLREQPKELVQFSGDESTLVLDGYTIEDEYLILDDNIALNVRLRFSGCTFNTEKLFFISGIVCHNFVTFQECTFNCNIDFDDGIFEKELLFKACYLDGINFSGGSFEKISVSGYEIGSIWISGSKFESFHLGEYTYGENVGELTVFAKSNETGDIFISRQNIGRLYLHGSNKDRKFSFTNIQCNQVHINDFVNEGTLNVFGIKPNDIANDNRYFQISKSNLDKAQFHRALFSLYKEVIIIDSFITDALFIGCSWGKNIRALNGPGYSDFEESLKTGRKLSSNEFLAIREAYRQLKISMSKHSDKILEHRFYSQELFYYNKTLSWETPWKNQFWDKIILRWSRIFSDNGQSFVKPLFWLLLGHFFFFAVAMFFNGFMPLHFSINEANGKAFEEAFEKYFIYINPLRKLETSLSGYLIIVDILMRIWSSYMLYNLVRASRRYIS